MSKGLIGAIVAIAALLAIGGIIFMNKSSSDRQESTNGATQQPAGNGASTNEQQSQTEGVHEDEILEGQVNIDINDFAFGPQTVTVRSGTTVTWTNQDSARHDIHPDEETDEFRRSELLAQGESYSVTFNTPGEYTYFCTPHPFMKASVVVVE